MKPVAGTKTVAKHLKFNESITNQTEWVNVEMDLIDFFAAADAATVDIDGINVWISHKCSEGCVVFDDFRLIQKDNYPVACALDSISLSEYSTEYDRGTVFSYDGKITAYYNDGSTKEISSDSEGVTISEPDLTTSGENKLVTVTYTEGGVTKKAVYYINVVGTDPEAEETLEIVSEENDLAKASCAEKTTQEYNCGVVADNTEDTYGNSTNSINVSNLSIDADTYINIKLGAPIIKETIHVKFFAKNLPSTHIYVQLLNRVDVGDRDPLMQRATYSAEDAKHAVDTNPSSSHSFTITPAGNGWNMYEFDYYAANVTDGVSYIRFSTCAKLAREYTFILDGIEVK